VALLTGQCGVDKCWGVASLNGCGHCGVSDGVWRINVVVASACYSVGPEFESRLITLGEQQ